MNAQEFFHKMPEVFPGFFVVLWLVISVSVGGLSGAFLDLIADNVTMF